MNRFFVTFVASLATSMAACGAPAPANVSADGHVSSAASTDAIASLPTFVDVQITFDAEHVGLAVDVLGRGFVHLTGQAVQDGTIGLDVKTDAGTTRVGFPITTGTTSEQVADRLTTELARLGLRAQTQYVLDRGELGKLVLLLVTKDGASPRPATVRDPSELAVAWHAVRVCEHGPILALDEQRDPRMGPVSDEVKALLPDLKNFVRYGTSALTPYEARELLLGTGDVGTYGLASDHLVSGDHVEVTRDSGAVERGLVLMTAAGYDGGHAWANVLVVDDAGYLEQELVDLEAPSGYRVSKVLSSALLDGNY